MIQPTDLQKNAIVSQILKSPEFHDSKRYQELLQYLVDKSSRVSTLKETEIAQEVFGKDSKFDPSTDPLIRSYISNLRKKLEHYYLTTRDTFDYKLEIPKGHYIVRYTPTIKVSEPTKEFSYKSYIYPAVIVILLTIIVIQFGKQSSSTVTENPLATNPIMSEFLKKESLPTLIVIGDYLLLSENIPEVGRTFRRVPQINNEKNMKEFASKYPKLFGNTGISEVTHIGAGASLGVTYLMQAFSGSLHKVSVKLSHELKWDDIENHNVIYVGTFKTLYKLDTLFSRTNVRYRLKPNNLNIVGKQKDTIKSFNVTWWGGNYQKDYSVILKLVSSKNNTIMFLTGFSEIAVMDAIKSAIDPEFIGKIKKFSKTIDLSSPFHFELISEVEGLRYTVLGTQIKYLQKF